MLFLLTDSPQKTKIGKDSWYFNNSKWATYQILCVPDVKKKKSLNPILYFVVSPSSPQLQRLFFFLLKTQKNNHSSASYWWEYTKSRFKENTKIFSKTSNTQENITNSRQNLLFLLKTKNNHSLASDWLGNTKSNFKENARIFSKISTTQENINILRLKTYTKKKTSNQKLNQ